MKRVLGLDLDNTIICYDHVFWQVAQETGLLTEDRDSLSKAEVKSALHSEGRHEEWTRLQGRVYGPEIMRATLFPGLLGFWNSAQEQGWTVCIVSHKTAKPALGPPHDLHAAARGWLEHHGLWNDKVFFEPTEEAKIARLRALECQIFVDDLPKVLLNEQFPASVEKWLFDSQKRHDGHAQKHHWRSFEDWNMAQRWLEERS